MVVAPTPGTHHPLGLPWRALLGGPDTIPTISEDERDLLFAVASMFDAMPVREEPEYPRSTGTAPRPDGTLRPGDDYNRRMAWPTLLERHGWQFVYERDGVARWCRPGKARAVSATTNYAGSDLFYPFTSSTAFDPDRSYSKFAAYAVLEHGGDFAKAARALGQQGYGEQEPRTRTTDRSAPGGPKPHP